MKRIILTTTLLCAILAISCKKDKNEAPEIKSNVEYIIRCQDCTATLDVASGKKTVKVLGEVSVFDNNQLTDITVSTVGKGDSEVNIKIDEISVYFALKAMTNGSAVHNVKVVR